MSNKTASQGQLAALRWSLIAGVAVFALFGAFAFAQSRTTTVQAATTGQVPGAAVVNTAGATDPSSGSAGGSGSGCACCGGSAQQGPATTGAATVSGGVQKITVDGSSGSYNPNTIELKAGVPAEITFQNAGGCNGIVQSQDLGFSVDFTSGPQTVKLGALQPGTYSFACSMNMVTGTIVVK